MGPALMQLGHSFPSPRRAHSTGLQHSAPAVCLPRSRARQCLPASVIRPRGQGKGHAWHARAASAPAPAAHSRHTASDAEAHGRQSPLHTAMR